MKVLVTGGAGFIGSNLVDKLVNLSHEVVVLDNCSTGRLSNLSRVKNKIKFVNADITIANNNLTKHFHKVDWVFHLAGLADIVPSIKNPYNYFQTNVKGTLNILEASKKIKIIGDKSLSKRDMKRIIDPLTEFGATFYPKNKNTLPLYIKGSNYLTPINYLELKGSSQCKSSVMLAALLTPGETKLKCKPSRNHTELLFKYLKIPIKILRRSSLIK